MAKKKTSAAKAEHYTPEEFSGRKFRRPLEDGAGFIIRDEAEHALFLRLCELYRVLDLFQRQLPDLLERYSKYHQREQFAETLKVRFFDVNEGLAARMDPGIVSCMFVLFNRLHEMKVALSMTESLPYTLRSEMDEVIIHLNDAWNRLITDVQARYGWSFRRLTNL